MTRTAHGLLADFAAATSLGGVTVSWVAQAGAILQLGAAAIAIVAGIYAIRWHRIRIKLAKEKLNDLQDKSD